MIPPLIQKLQRGDITTMDKEAINQDSLEDLLTEQEPPEPLNQDPIQDQPTQTEEPSQWLVEVERCSTVEEKLAALIEAMRATFSQGATPRWKPFWEMRTFCISLFKESVHPAIRAKMWEQYTELSQEARRLKSLLDEQASFAAEQIELALTAMERDLLDLEERSAKGIPLPAADPEPPFTSKSLEGKKSLYQTLQRELSLLNTHSTRLTALRQELLKTEMRTRHKSQLFRRLSSLGDRIFPRRKELIKKLSAQFTSDVAEFVEKNFGPSGPRGAFYVLRDEIKALQSLAKESTLNTQAFTETRAKLSACWDQVKAGERERKKEQQQRRETCKDLLSQISQKLDPLIEQWKGAPFSVDEAQRQLDEIATFARQLDLGFKEKQLLRDRLSEARKLIEEKASKEEEQHRRQQQEQEASKRQKVTALLFRVEALSTQAASLDHPALFIAEAEALLSEIAAEPFSKGDRFAFTQPLRALRDLIAEAKESTQQTSSSDRADHLRALLQQRKERRQEIKDQIEEYRRSAATSGLDFEKAIALRDLLNGEKERLEKINAGIQDLETELASL